MFTLLKTYGSKWNYTFFCNFNNKATYGIFCIQNIKGPGKRHVEKLRKMQSLLKTFSSVIVLLTDVFEVMQG